MENIFTKVYFYVNLKGKKINEKNEVIMREIIAELKVKAQKMIEEKLEKEDKN